MIMESLGGDQFWVDRFMAQHAAVFYFWVLIGFFAFFPSLAYMFSELVEVGSFPPLTMLLSNGYNRTADAVFIRADSLC